MERTRTQPLIAVRDVRASACWYGELLDADALPDHEHRALYDRISRSGELLLQLHAWDVENHPGLVTPGAGPPGHGIVLWFETPEFDAAVGRARGLGATILEEPHFNPAPRHREIWLRDPDGYGVVLASPDGEETPTPPGTQAAGAEPHGRNPALRAESTPPKGSDA